MPATEPDFDEMDAWCVECGDPFHLDDTGGYNPPCPCCGLCRSCCPRNPNNQREDDWRDASLDDGADYPYDEVNNPDGYR